MRLHFAAVLTRPLARGLFDIDTVARFPTSQRKVIWTTMVYGLYDNEYKYQYSVLKNQYSLTLNI